MDLCTGVCIRVSMILLHSVAIALRLRHLVCCVKWCHSKCHLQCIVVVLMPSLLVPVACSSISSGSHLMIALTAVQENVIAGDIGEMTRIKCRSHLWVLMHSVMVVALASSIYLGMWSN